LGLENPARFGYGGDPTTAMGVGGRRQGGRPEEDMGLPNPTGAIQSRGGEGQEEVGGDVDGVVEWRGFCG
jgi:hypothetical protein